MGYLKGSSRLNGNCVLDLCFAFLLYRRWFYSTRTYSLTAGTGIWLSKLWKSRGRKCDVISAISYGTRVTKILSLTKFLSFMWVTTFVSL